MIAACLLCLQLARFQMLCCDLVSSDTEYRVPQEGGVSRDCQYLISPRFSACALDRQHTLVASLVELVGQAPVQQRLGAIGHERSCHRLKPADGYWRTPAHRISARIEVDDKLAKSLALEKCLQLHSPSEDLFPSPIVSVSNMIVPQVRLHSLGSNAEMSASWDMTLIPIQNGQSRDRSTSA